MRRLVYLIIGMWVGTAYSQSGPGGVGDMSTNILWNKTDNLSGLNNNDKVSTWGDVSGNGNDFSQPTSAYQPSYLTNQLNGKAIIQFNQSNGRLRKTSFSDFPSTSITTFIVNKSTESNDGLLSYASNSNNNEFLLFNSSNLTIYRQNNSKATGIAINDNNWHIIDVSWTKSGGKTELWLDGNQSYTVNGLASGKSIVTNGSLALAGEQDAVDGNYDATQDHQGEFAEVIVFNTVLNDAERIIVANYLSSKYNIAVSNDYYSFESTHAYDLAGIGRVDGSNKNTSAQSAGILQIENASSLNGSNEFLLFGHNNGQIATWNSSNTPDGGVNIKRLDRTWKMDETGDVGTLDFRATIDALPSLSGDFTKYALLVDADGDFSSGSAVYELSLSGSDYVTQGIEITDGNYVTIGCMKPTVEHVSASSSGFEPDNASIDARLNFIPNNSYTVKYSTSDGSATAASNDYAQVTNGTITFTAGNAIASYSITINNDVVVESTENFSVTLSNPSGDLTLGANTIHTYGINDDDASRKIYFSQASSSGDENTLTVDITVAINSIDGVNPTTVDYAVSGGTAINGGTDYTLASGTTNIPAGSSTGTFQITITDDNLFETDETIIIELSNPTNCNLDGVAPYQGTGILTYTYTITDNEVAPEIQFTLSSNSTSEDNSPVNIEVSLDNMAGTDISATYTVANISATNGTDYALTSGSVTITAGYTTANISAVIYDDTNEETNETFSLTLSAPINANLGTNTVFTFTISDNDSFGHQGPGGVGNQESNILWLKSEDLSALTNGDDITSWTDASGNSNDFAQANTSYTPRYYTNVINGLPVVRFEQSNNRLVKTNFDDFGGNAVTVFLVNKNNESGDGVFSYASSAHDNDFLMYNSSNVGIYRGGSSVSTGLAINGNTWRIFSTIWNGSNGSTTQYSNGTQNYTGTLASGTNITSGGTLALGGEQDGVNSGYTSAQDHLGDFSEVIIYNTVLNTAKRKIVENYLSSKYNIALSSDLYSYDTGVSSYKYDVAGMGRDDANNFHTDAKGPSILRMNNASSLEDGAYLFWGHDGVDIDNGSFLIPWSGMPADVDNALPRIWRVDETGEVGTVSVTVDLSGFTINSSNDLVLLIDSDDGDFINATQIPLGSYVASRGPGRAPFATFNNVNFSSGDRFTIGSKSALNALPIELKSFSVEQKEETASIKWTTATETNNDFFTIEKSNDKENWLVVTTVKGAGTSINDLNYSIVDYTPFSGTSYYRLKQTDFDGKYTYSNIKSLTFKEARKEYSVFPIPAKDYINIESKNLEDLNLYFYDMNGREIHLPIAKDIQKATINTSSLKTGMYILIIKDALGVETRKISIKQ